MNEQAIKEAYAKLPRSIKEAIANSGWEESLDQIVKKFSARIDQHKDMEDDIVLVMVGLMPVKDFLGALEKIDLPQKDSNAKMIQEIEDKIFNKIRQAVIEKTAGSQTLEPYEGTLESEVKGNQPVDNNEDAQSISEDHHDLESRDEIMGMIESDEDDVEMVKPLTVEIPAQNTAPQENEPQIVPENLPGKPAETELGSPANTDLSIPSSDNNPEPPASPAEENQSDIVAENLTKPSVSTPERKIDPYREPIE